MKNRVTKIRLTPEEAEAEALKNQPEAQRPLSPKEQEQLAFRTGSRAQRRKIAKRNGFFKDKTGTAWRESNRMVREDNPDVSL